MMTSMNKRKTQGGFTVVEIMVALSVLAILLSLAVPNFSSFSSARQLGTTVFDLHSDLMLARSEALKRNRQVSVEPKGEDWSDGWEVVTEDDEVLSERTASSQMVAVEEGSVDAVTFNGDGRVTGVAGSLEIGLGLSGAGDEHARCIKISATGRPATTKVSCA